MSQRESLANVDGAVFLALQPVLEHELRLLAQFGIAGRQALRKRTQQHRQRQERAGDFDQRQPFSVMTGDVPTKQDEQPDDELLHKLAFGEGAHWYNSVCWQSQLIEERPVPFLT